MAIEFHEDAIILSGSTGTKLKSEIIGRYYPFWWRIASGGDVKNHGLETSIVELNAATGENYIEDVQEIILGSSGHALDLKLHTKETDTLRLILIEENQECFIHLKKVIDRRWGLKSFKEPSAGLNIKDQVVLMNYPLRKALNYMGLAKGRSIFFFDPLLYTPYEEVARVANNRLKRFYQIGTEFILFVFTSDWFKGRKSVGLAALPETTEETWSPVELSTVEEADKLFGDTDWRNTLLKTMTFEEKVNVFVEEYTKRLHRWFRYVLPLPFEPKNGQIYHLFFTSNYEAGIRTTRNFYYDITKTEPDKPNNQEAYNIFKYKHAGESFFNGLRGIQRPMEWKILWEIIKNHEDGFCDSESPDLINKEEDGENRGAVIDWLEDSGYLLTVDRPNVNWEDHPQIFQLNWEKVEETFGIKRTPKLEPLHP